MSDAVEEYKAVRKLFDEDPTRRNFSFEKASAYIAALEAELDRERIDHDYDVKRMGDARRAAGEATNRAEQAKAKLAAVTESYEAALDETARRTEEVGRLKMLILSLKARLAVVTGENDEWEWVARQQALETWQDATDALPTDVPDAAKMDWFIAGYRARYRAQKEAGDE